MLSGDFLSTIIITGPPSYCMVLYNEKLCYSQKKNRIDNYVNRHNKITSTMWALRADTFLALFQKVVQAQVHVRFWFGTVEKKL